MLARPRILIIGAGIGGAALGLFLDKAGIGAARSAAAPADAGPAGGALQMAPNGMHILAQLGLADALAARGAAATTMQFRNARGTLLSRVEFQLAARYGSSAVNATRHDVHDLLVGELRRRGVAIHWGRRLRAIDDRTSAAICRFEDGSDVEAGVVIGADGIHSRVRAALLPVHRGWCAPVETAIRRSATPIFMDNIFDIRRLPIWHRGRIGLIGDAAHAVSPHAGQGASMALEDAMVLARHLRDHLQSPEEAFSRFEADRRARAEQVVEAGRRSGNQKRELGVIGAWARDRFVSLVLPSVIRWSTDRLYRYQPVWS